MRGNGGADCAGGLAKGERRARAPGGMKGLMLKSKPTTFLQFVRKPIAQARAANDNRRGGEELIARIMSNHPDLTREDIELLLLAADWL